MSEPSPKRRTPAATVAVVVWTCLNLYLCGSAVNEQAEKVAVETDRALGAGVSVFLYGIIWTGGLLVIALLKYLIGKK